MRHNRFLPLLIPFIVLVFFEWYFFSHKMIYVCAVLVNLFIFFVFRQFTKDSSVDKRWWNFMLLPSIFSVSVMFYSTMVTSRMFIQFLFFVYLIFLYLYLRLSYYYLLQPIFYEGKSLENISSYGSFFSFFFFSSASYGLVSFLNSPIWILILFLLLFSAMVVYQLIWLNGIDLKDAALCIPISCFVIIEIAWSISFLPLNFNISGLLLSICFYVLFNLLKHHLRDNLDAKMAKRYLFFGFLSSFVVLLTSRWM